MNKIYVLGLIVFIIFGIYYYMNQSSRKIVSVYAPDSYFGLGDYIRGIIHLYQNENENNIYVNYETNEIAKYLHNTYGNNAPFEKDEIIITNEHTYADLTTNTDVYLYHNASITYPIDKNILYKVRKIFEPKEEFKQLIDKEIEKLVNGEEFIVIHVRLNDDVFIQDRELHNLRLEKKIRDLSESQIVIMSNSNATKNNLSTKYGLKYINVIPAHTGAIGVKGDIKDTMLEFFVMSRAKHIYQFCETSSQKSGFSQRISEIYDIPLTRI